MPGKAPPSAPTSVIYARVSPGLKAELRAFADREHGGNMAAALRDMLVAVAKRNARAEERLEALAHYQEAEDISRSVKRLATGAHSPGFLDED